MRNEMLGELVWKKYEWKLVYFIIKELRLFRINDVDARAVAFHAVVVVEHRVGFG